MKRVMAVVAVFAVAVAVGASAFFTAPGTANGGAAVGTLPPATGVGATVVGPTVREVDVTWSASGAPGGEPVDGFYVERVSGSVVSAACGTSAGSPLPAGTLSCRDSAVPSGDHTYRVTRLFRTWTAVSAASAPVTVPTAVPAGLTLQTPAAVTAGVPFDIRITALDQYGEPFTGWSGARCVALAGPQPSPSGAPPVYPAPGGCANGSSIAFAAGVATPTLTLVAAESTTLTATDVASGIASAASSVTVAAGPAGGLAFVQPPTGGTTGVVLTPAIVVRVTDVYANPVGDAGRLITAEVASGPGSLTPSSTVTATTTGSGSATFADLALDADGTYQLRMTSGGWSVTSVPFAVLPPPPTATAATPSARGQGAANQVVTITGTNFRSGATASFGSGVTVGATTFVSSTQLTATISIEPTATIGSRTVTVTNPPGFGSATCAACFTVTAAPGATLTLAPASRGRGATGQTVTVTGTNFQSGAVVAFAGSGITVNSTTFVSATQLTVSVTVAADAALGSRDVIVTNPDGGTRTAVNGFTVTAAPAPTSASPAARPQGAANQAVTITGANFVTGATVAFAGPGVTVNSTTFVSATQLTVDVTVAAGAAPGPRDVHVTNPDAGVGVCAGCFTVAAAPTVTAIDPDFGLPNTAYSAVTVTGANFVTGATVAFSGSGITVTSVSTTSSTQLTIDIAVAAGATLGNRTVSVTNPDGGRGACAACYTVTAGPTATAASPSTRGQGATNQNVTITGTFFRATPTVAISGANVTVNSTTFVSATQLTVNVTVAAGALTGARNVVVTNATGFGAATCTGCFTVTARPGTFTLNPTSRSQGVSNQNVTVTGSGFVSGATVAFAGSGITVNSTTFVSATQLTVNISIAAGAPTGARDVTVTHPDAGVRVLTGGFTVNAAPTATAITPSPRGQGFSGNVTVTGSNFVTGATAAFSGTGITVNSTTRNSATQLTLAVTVAPGAGLGARDLVVTQPDGGTATCAGCLTVSVRPLPTSINPATRVSLSSGVHTITGTGFQSGATVSINGLLGAVSNVNVVSSTQITLTVTAILGLGIGANDVTVTNSDGGTGTCAGCLVITLV